METKSSIYNGVSFNKASNKWIARINHNGQQIFIGYFSDKADAAHAYDRKASELFKVFAKLNF